MFYNVSQSGTSIEIIQSNEGMLESLEDVRKNILDRDKLTVIENIYLIIEDKKYLIPNCLDLLKSSLSANDIFNQKNITSGIDYYEYSRTLMLNAEENARKQAIELAKIEESNIERYNSLQKSGSLSLRELISKYKGQNIAIDALKASELESAVLSDVQSDYITVDIRNLQVHIPYSQIIRVISSKNNEISIGFFKGNYPLVIRVFDFVIYKGAIGFGISMPIDNN